MKRIQKFSCFILFGLGVVLTSCTDNYSGKPVSLGRNSEVLVYCSNKIWKSEIKDTIIKVLMAEQIGLNQPEPMFELIHIDKLDELYKKHRNILQVIISDTVKKPVIRFSLNPYANPQTFLQISAVNNKQFSEIFLKSKNTVIKKFKETDFLRIQDAYSRILNRVVQNQLKAMFGIELTIPETYKFAKTNTDFAWLRLETNKYSQGLLIYQVPFKDSSDLSLGRIINIRNKFTSQNIPGSVDGSYMMTDTVIAPVMQFSELKVGKTFEIRGLWRTFNDFMGGPFVLYVIHDTAKQRLLFLEGYVYYPNNEKRDLLLQLEAIIRSLTFSVKKDT